MSKENDKKAKVAPPREADHVRFNRLMNQLGLKEQFSAKQRRFLSSTQKKRR